MSSATRRYKRIWSALGWGLGGLVALAAVLVLSGATWNALADARDRRRFPPTGKQIEVDGRMLHLDCTGQGQPTVVLDTGFRMPALGWALVQPKLAQQTRVCSYDRPGMGYSDLDPKRPPHSPGRIAEQLHRLLQRAGEKGPFVLVGHSHGGLMARAYYNRFPKEVAGMVLIDSSSEWMEEVFHGKKDWQPAYFAELAQERRREPLMRLLIWSGLLRWQLGQAAHNTGFPGLTPELIDRGIFLMNQPGWYPASIAELEGVPETYAEFRTRSSLGDLPLIVLTAGKFTPKGTPDSEVPALRRTWVDELQPKLAHLSSRGRQIIADSGHMIPFDAPDAAVAAVVAMVHATASR